MSAELIVAAMLDTSEIVALVGSRRALAQLPQNTAMPALVYTLIDSKPAPNVAYHLGPQRAQARVQINPLATTIGSVKAIHEAVRVALDFKHQVSFNGQLVISCRLEMMGPVEKDLEAGVWTQPYDYLLHYIEAPTD
ncbi:tail completion protein gp17 [Zwartia panacis]|uniref:tail completion protein gp17 n=1 Tax=Zwartia panacis TaxID=2683345 RepID=UPI0025B39F4C|nr:DUF3168 domain-containing protein [Zwartia panacis]MDN4015893.1 hypothetical protein [Zwartia panacis]